MTCTKILVVNATLHQISGDDVLCPGDSIVYICLVTSNSENFFLTWHITLPGNLSVNITYSNSERLDTTVFLHFNPDITSILTKFIPSQVIESIIVFTVPDSGSVLVNETILECGTSERAVDALIMSDFSPGKFLPWNN